MPNCPNCGAEHTGTTDAYEHFWCGTRIDKADGFIIETEDCLRNQLAAAQAEHGELKCTLRDAYGSITALKAENTQLQGIVEKLPKTADGVAITPQMSVWILPGIISGPEPTESRPVLVGPVDGLPYQMLGEVQKYYWTFLATDCYSTKEAAEAAKAEGEKV